MRLQAKTDTPLVADSTKFPLNCTVVLEINETVPSDKVTALPVTSIVLLNCASTPPVVKFTVLPVMVGSTAKAIPLVAKLRLVPVTSATLPMPIETLFVAAVNVSPDTVISILESASTVPTVVFKLTPVIVGATSITAELTVVVNKLPVTLIA